MRLRDFADKADDHEGAVLELNSPATLAPNTIINFKKLSRLDLLNDEVILSLLGQAPIDPLGIYQGIRAQWPDWNWAFEPSTFCVVNVLRREQGKVLAYMTLDLLSDDIVFYAKKGDVLTTHSQLTAEEFLQAGLQGAELLEKRIQEVVKDNG